MSVPYREARHGFILILEVTEPLLFGPSLNQLSRRVKAEDSCKAILVDLTDCPRIDSAGLGELVLCFGQAARLDKRFALTGVHSQAMRLIEVTHIDQLIRITNTRLDAFEALGA